MERNVEIKARVPDLAPVRARARSLGGEPEVIEQEDTFLPCATGRLKVRRFADGSGELIFYRRPDRREPAESSYVVVPVADAAALVLALAGALGTRGVVRKRREVHRLGRTRVHLDRVEGLGDFVELEVVLAPGETQVEGVREAEGLIDRLGIPRDGLVEGAYIDLLEAADG